MTHDDFHTAYAAALRGYLETRNQEDLAVGHELGRRALHDDISMLEIVEKHSELFSRLVAEFPGFDGAVALAFLSQTPAPLDVATRGFLDGTKRYEEQRARAEDLADRDEFRNAVANPLQEESSSPIAPGPSSKSTTLSPNSPATRPTPPYQWPFPRLVDEKAALSQQSRMSEHNQAQHATPIRHRDGRLVRAAANINRVNADAADVDVDVGRVGTHRQKAFAARESAALRPAMAVSGAKSSRRYSR